MKEHFIKNKVIDLANKFRIPQKFDELKLERAISRIEHHVACELEKVMRENLRHMNEFISQAIRKEIV